MSGSGSSSPSVSATATATSTTTDLRPVLAAAAQAATLAAQDEQLGTISGSTILGLVLGGIVVWGTGVTVYFQLRKRIRPKQVSVPSKQTTNPMNPSINQVSKQSSPPLRTVPEPIQKPAVLTVSMNHKIVSGVIHAPVSLPSPQLRPMERRDLQVFQATTVRNIRSGSRAKQIKREYV